VPAWRGFSRFAGYAWRGAGAIVAGIFQAASQRIDDMTETANDFAQSDADILLFDVPDAALEAAAAAMPGGAFSMPNSPTVSIVFQCCSND
jgi:hypothetical protein